MGSLQLTAPERQVPEQRLVRSAELDEAARKAELARVLAHVKAVASGVERVGERLTLTYWVEGGALTLLDYRAQPGSHAERVRPEQGRERLEREVELALGNFGSSSPGQLELVLRRERVRWVLESVARRELARPAEARRLAVRTEGVPTQSYLQAHELASRMLELLRVPEGGEAELEVAVRLEDGRVLEVETRRYQVLSGTGTPRLVRLSPVGEVTWLLLGFADGLGPRTARLRLRATHAPGEQHARGWVEAVEVERPMPPAEQDEDFAAAYRKQHELTLRRWREELADGTQWVLSKGVEELALWYAGGIIGRGTGILADLTLPIIKTVLGRGGSTTARWLRSSIVRLPPELKRDFERLWAKVHLEGEAALTTMERDTLRQVMVRLEQVLAAPLQERQKKEFRRLARQYYKTLHPEHAALMDLAPNRYPVHHKKPLEYAHLFPDEDINAAEHLVMVQAHVHERINALWTRFRMARPNATAAEAREMAQKLDEFFGAWYHQPVDPPGLSLDSAERAAVSSLMDVFPGF